MSKRSAARRSRMGEGVGRTAALEPGVGRGVARRAGFTSPPAGAGRAGARPQLTAISAKPRSGQSDRTRNILVQDLPRGRAPAWVRGATPTLTLRAVKRIIVRSW